MHRNVQEKWFCALHCAYESRFAIHLWYSNEWEHQTTSLPSYDQRINCLTLKSDKNKKSAKTFWRLLFAEHTQNLHTKRKRMSPPPPPPPHYKFQRRSSNLRSFQFLWILLAFCVCHIPLVHTDLCKYGNHLYFKKNTIFSYLPVSDSHNKRRKWCRNWVDEGTSVSLPVTVAVLLAIWSSSNFKFEFGLSDGMGQVVCKKINE